ncbi:ACS family hexuronate transporter-like MFS transporter [Mucilaginibacter frigoritolerans]|uniref:ACS family hexuronate transporter-like MFS transporter n=1 Tax=Mucilaginibacter frigoritolerans TaxID=652788 RepID=A0A562U7Q0_9SPHI|nr:MFS transporter [Mucilaginibacter frigoritolerans]TWJ01629.1 ACS family hexuronate transporter-like MFS transporter [Mucilaginibacter frigoritolerans]
MKPSNTGNYRWTICALVFFATTINYLDRAVISLLKSDLTKTFNWNDGDYANIEIAFKIAYSFGLLGAGRLIDKLGTKSGYFLSTFLWSIAAVCHALVKSTLGFGVVRAALGLSEAGNFPAAIKTVAEWFPKKERAMATGIFNSGANIGAIVAPLTVPFIVVAWGWQWAFIITGAMGFLWLVLWYIYYDTPSKQKRLSKTEADYINGDGSQQAESDDKLDDQEKVSWFKLLSFKQTWAFSTGKFLTDPIWWFYLFWLPDFMESEYGLKGTAIALPVALVYTMSAIGSILGGYLPKYLIDKNWTAFRARKTSMLIYAIAVIPIVFAQLLGSINLWLAVIIIGVAAAAHQAWSANIFTTVSDMFPKKAVGSVTGIGGMFGSIGSVLLSIMVQKGLFVHYRSIHQIETAYYIMFFICGSAYILAWLLMHTIVPKFKPIKF